MNIALVTRRFFPAPGGVEKQVFEIARRLSQRGHQVTVFASDLYADIPPRRLPKHVDDDLNAFDISRHMAVPVPLRNARGTSFAPTMLLALAGKNLPEIVHAHGWNLVSVSALLLAKSVLRCRTVCTTHVDPTLLTRGFSAAVLTRFDGIVALTEIEKSHLLKLGVDESRIRVIPNGVPTDDYAHLPEPDYFRRKHGIMNHMILYAGRIESTRKGCATLIEAVSEAQRTVGDCTVVLAGPDWGSEIDLRRLAERKGVRVIFPGNLGLEELKGALSACDIFVLPSLSEAFGISILEAMICGAPVVASRVGGIPALVRDEETGLLVAPGDPHDLSRAICRILADRELVTRMTRNGKSLASQYSIENTVLRLEALYVDLVRTRST